MKKDFHLGGGQRELQFVFEAFVLFSSIAVALMLLRRQNEYILELPNPFEEKNMFVTLIPLIWPTGSLGRFSCCSRSRV